MSSPVFLADSRLGSEILPLPRGSTMPSNVASSPGVRSSSALISTSMSLRISRDRSASAREIPFERSRLSAMGPWSRLSPSWYMPLKTLELRLAGTKDRVEEHVL